MTLFYHQLFIYNQSDGQLKLKENSLSEKNESVKN